MAHLKSALLLWLLLAWTMIGCSTRPTVAEPGAPYGDALIVPKQRIGAAVLGMTEPQMVKWIGRPDETVGSGDGAYLFRGKGLQIAFSHQGAYMVAVTKPGFSTADGISVGMEEEEVRTKWGEPTDRYEIGQCAEEDCDEMAVQTVQYCFANGMQIDVDATTRRVTRLQVASDGCALP